MQPKCLSKDEKIKKILCIYGYNRLVFSHKIKIGCF